MLFSPCISEWLPHPQHARGLEVVWFPGGYLGGWGIDSRRSVRPGKEGKGRLVGVRKLLHFN